MFPYQRKLVALSSCVLAAMVALAGCRSAPVTQRKQLLLIPEGHEMALGEASYREIVAQAPRSKNRQYVEMVERAGRRVAQAANRPDYQWEFAVIESDQQNAFCLPGGKVAVYEGIMPVCEDEAGLAVVLSHEIAHALARHGGERMSQEMMANGISMVVNQVTRKQEEYNRKLIQQAYGAASQYGVILPFSRKHELEADRMGLMLMAKAGYDPSAAPRFWGRFASAHQGAGAPEFFSTHPADERRSADLQTALPEAVALYQSAPAQFGLGERIAANTPQAQPVRLSGQQTPAPSVSRAPAASSGAGQPPVRGR